MRLDHIIYTASLFVAGALGDLEREYDRSTSQDLDPFSGQSTAPAALERKSPYGAANGRLQRQQGGRLQRRPWGWLGVKKSSAPKPNAIGHSSKLRDQMGTRWTDAYYETEKARSRMNKEQRKILHPEGVMPDRAAAMAAWNDWQRAQSSESALSSLSSDLTINARKADL